MEKIQFLPLEEWGMNLKAPLLISGPCSAESPSQVSETLRQLSELPVQIFRAGIWKPRTRPNSFEGVGSVGMKWLKDAARESGIPVSVEVANVKHVYEALRNGVDILWIGARTTTNPFAVQEIADALEGVDVPVMIKNPVNPDLELWIGAIERIHRAGIRRIAAIHRGFSTYSKTKYRNNPHWEIPIELRRRYPDLPLICDPSHICGTRELIQSVSQKALDLNFDGLMIESHFQPDKALSDAKQQVTPERLGEILHNLIHRTAEVENPQVLSKLEDLREMIDDMDEKLIKTLGQRMELVRLIGEYKKDNNIAILQAARWNEIIQDRLTQALPLGLEEDFVVHILQLIHKESIRNQARVMNEENERMSE